VEQVLCVDCLTIPHVSADAQQFGEMTAAVRVNLLYVELVTEYLKIEPDFIAAAQIRKNRVANHEYLGATCPPFL
jgi:hypothetical protein